MLLLLLLLAVKISLIAALEAPDACSDDDCWCGRRNSLSTLLCLRSSVRTAPSLSATNYTFHGKTQRRMLYHCNLRERKAHELQLRREAAAAAASRAVSAQAVSGGSSETGAASCWSDSGTPLKQLIAAAWHLGSADIFSFQAAVQGSRSSNAGDAEIEMRIVKVRSSLPTASPPASATTLNRNHRRAFVCVCVCGLAGLRELCVHKRRGHNHGRGDNLASRIRQGP